MKIDNKRPKRYLPIAVSLLAFAVAFTVVPPIANANHLTCNGFTTTAGGDGTDADNTITGTANRDVINALGGNDTVNGLGGIDEICGGSGADTLDGGSSADRIFGEAGNDTILGQAGADDMPAGDGDDIIYNNNANVADTFIDSALQGQGHVNGDTCHWGDFQPYEPDGEPPDGEDDIVFTCETLVRQKV